MRLLKVILVVVMFLSFVVAPLAKADDKQVTAEDKGKNCCVMESKEDYSLMDAGTAQLLYAWLLKGSYDRVGKVPYCASGKDHDAGLCYDKCPAGFKGVGPVCWQQCEEGYKDDGATCRRDANIFGKDSYGRGAGYAEWHKKKCEKEEGRSCEKYGALYYPTCRDGYDNEGCCICRQKSCPEGYNDDGATCRRDVHIYAKKSQGRGAGTPPKTCGADKGYTDLSEGMCYKPAQYCHDCLGSHCIRTATDCGMCKASKAYVGGTPMPFEDKMHQICATSQAYADSCAKDRSWASNKSNDRFDLSTGTFACRGKNLVILDDNGYIVKDK